jgi:hypothetical protein
VLVNNRGLAEFWPWLASPVILAAIVYVLLFVYPVPELNLDVSEMGIFRWFGKRDSDMS